MQQFLQENCSNRKNNKTFFNENSFREIVQRLKN